MDYALFTTGQQKAMLESLNNQKVIAGPELKHRNALRLILAEEVTTECGRYTVLRSGDFVRLIAIDTCGDNYRNCWLKVNSTQKGEYFTSTYLGAGRIYL